MFICMYVTLRYIANVCLDVLLLYTVLLYTANDMISGAMTAVPHDKCSLSGTMEAGGAMHGPSKSKQINKINFESRYLASKVWP